MRQVLIISYFVCIGTITLAQQKPGVKLLAKAKDGTILLRWAPTNPLTWSQANQKGYQIERYLITRKEEVIKKPEKLLLTPGPLKPKPLAQWQTDAEKNDFSAIAAQAIYGSSFDVTLPQNAGLTEAVNRSKELEQRFSFALFAADHSFQTARLSALGFKDSIAKKDERYLYRVYVANQDPKIKLDTGIFYLGLQDTVGLTPPLNLTAQFADHMVLLKWPKSFVQQTYTSFVIERSEAGGEFVRRNSAPYINSSSNSEAEMFFQVLDSLPQNDVEYQYRIRGVTPFGETGPESERVGGKGFRTLDVKASIIEAREEKGKVHVQWRILGNKSSSVGQYVERASNTDGTFQRLNEKPLNPYLTNYTDETPQATNYYRIKTMGANGQSSTSFPLLVQLIDSIPPAQPQGLKIKVDTAGVAKLVWNPNTEKDLLGYKIYRSNFKSAEFSEINASAVSLASFADTLNIKTLSNKIYYKLAAFDKRMNRSVFSPVVEVALPDIIPPMPPSIKEIRPDSKGIFIAWNPSSSEDVVSYLLERKAKDSVQWKLIKNFKPTDSSFYRDKNIRETTYQYRMFSIDKSKLKSSPSNLVLGEGLHNNQKPAVKNLFARAERENKTITLTWSYNETSASKYLIYRAIENEPMSLYKTISGNERSFRDENLKMNTKYFFCVRAVFSNGNMSEISKKIEVKY